MAWYGIQPRIRASCRGDMILMPVFLGMLLRERPINIGKVDIILQSDTPSERSETRSPCPKRFETVARDLDVSIGGAEFGKQEAPSLVNRKRL